MCGILGALDESLEEGRFESSLKLLDHRGPNNREFKRFKKLLLGHTRLSIIDLSKSANQPMEIDGYVLVFNGEIYNYKELKAKYNLKCKSSCDSEVLLLLYRELGEKVLDELNGMFAFAIYDIFKNRLFLARDRFGKKPLYYYKDESRFYFASEIKSILPLLDSTPAMNKEAIYDYFGHLNAIEPKTIYKNIFKIPQSSYIYYELSSGKLTHYRYYELAKFLKPHAKRERAEILKDIESLIFKSIELRLVSDVEIGSLLSGGVDSSLVTKLYSLISNSKVSTFFIGFDEHKRYDEREFAKIASKNIGTNHYEHIISKKEFLEGVDCVVSALDEPLGDCAAIPLYLLSKEIDRAGLKVVLSGEGSDEIFGGYDRYLALLGDKNSYRGFIEPFSRDELKLLFSNYKGKNSDSFFDSFIQDGKNISNLSIVDLSHWIPEVLMTKVDRTTQAFGVECRSPFLDFRVVEYLLGVDSKNKIDGGTKSLLKEIAIKYLPKEIVYRRKKGFSSPYFEWCYPIYKETLFGKLQKIDKELEIFNMNYIKDLIKNAESKNQKQQFWSLLFFALWFDD